MKYINLIIAVFMGASFALAAPTIAKDSIQGLEGSLDYFAPVFLKALNISAHGPGPQPTSIPVPFDGALVKTRAPSSIECDFWNDGGLGDTIPEKVRNNIKELRGRSDKPPTVAAKSFTADSWSLIADGAQAAMDNCGPKDGVGFEGLAIYDKDWCVGVSAYDTCDKET